TCFLNPACSPSNVYSPRGSARNSKYPSVFERCSRAWPVSSLVSLTLVPTITAPVRSLTIPWMVLVAVCAYAPAAARNKRHTPRSPFIANPSCRDGANLPSPAADCQWNVNFWKLGVHLTHVVFIRPRFHALAVGRATTCCGHVSQMDSLILEFRCGTSWRSD